MRNTGIASRLHVAVGLLCLNLVLISCARKEPKSDGIAEIALQQGVLDEKVKLWASTFELTKQHVVIVIDEKSIKSFQEFCRNEKGKTIKVFILPPFDNDFPIEMVLPDVDLTDRLTIPHGGSDASEEEREAIYEMMLPFFPKSNVK